MREHDDKGLAILAPSGREGYLPVVWSESRPCLVSSRHLLALLCFPVVLGMDVVGSSGGDYWSVNRCGNDGGDDARMGKVRALPMPDEEARRRKPHLLAAAQTLHSDAGKLVILRPHRQAAHECGSEACFPASARCSRCVDAAQGSAAPPGQGCRCRCVAAKATDNGRGWGDGKGRA